MKSIAVFYHCRLSGGRNVDNGASIESGWARELYRRQMLAVIDSGLSQAMSEMFIGVNVPDAASPDIAFCWNDAPSHATVIPFVSESLLPTMRFMQKWLAGHEDWYVAFHHMKGATHPRDPFTTAWRDCMENHVIWNWRQCVDDLDAGADAVGCHWIQGKRDDPNLRQPKFFGGIFWFAKASFLLKLPPLPEKVSKREDWYEGEWWVGSGPEPKIVDYHPSWPNLQGCRTSAAA